MRLTSAGAARSDDSAAGGGEQFERPAVPTPNSLWRSQAARGGRQFANALTALRIFVTVPLVLLAISDSAPDRLWAAGLLAFAGLTDGLDGAVARRFGITSALGAFLDPLADKFVIDGCIVAMVLHASFPLSLAAVLLGRDLIVTAMRVWGGASRPNLRPGLAAKAKTCVLYAGLFGLLVGGATPAIVGQISWVLVWSAAVLSLISGAGYAQRLMRRSRVSPSFVLYLIVPRPRPLFSAGKMAFFIFGSLVALSAGYRLQSLRVWLLAFVCYELILGQGRYLLNDLAGAGSDAHFLRGARNRCPTAGSGVWLIAAFAALRTCAAVVVLYFASGTAAALLAVFAIALQLAYELLKPSRLPARGLSLFLIVGAGYGQRALAGLVAVDGFALGSLVGALTFTWAAGLGSLFLSVCWQHQGQYYLVQRKLSPALLHRYKPGVLALYSSRLVRGERAGERLPRVLLYGLALTAALFAYLGTGDATVRAITACGYLVCVALGAFAVPAAARRGRGMLTATVPALICGASATVLALEARIAYPLPFLLVAIAFLSYLLLTSGTARDLLMDGATETDPAAA
jgi:cardiolipin synthase